MAKRISSQLSLFPSKELDSLTTNRSSIWRNHLVFFQDQPLTRILFGGN